MMLLGQVRDVLDPFALVAGYSFISAWLALRIVEGLLWAVTRARGSR